MWPLAERARHRPGQAFDAYTAGLTPDLSIMDLLDAQPEFNKSPWDYLDALVSRRAHRPRPRVAGAIRQCVRRRRTRLRRRSPHYRGDLGRRKQITAPRAASWPVLRSTATLACVGRRRDYFREEFLSALEILARGDVKPERLIGSWAGAFGPTESMPTTFKRFAVDFDHDGRRDVVDSVADVVASTANNLKSDGWVPGESWGYEVALPQSSIICSPIAPGR